MSTRTITITDALHEYLLSVSLREPEVLRRLREHTAQMSNANMQISPEQGQLMALLARLMGAETYLEVGVFTGYSSLCMALALSPRGRVTACDISEEYTAVARRFWEQAGMAQKIDLRLAPAADTLNALIDEGRAGQYDIAFIDADKTNYWTYYDRCLTLLRPGGLIAVDNTLWSGQVIDPDDTTADTQALRDFNRKLHEDERVDLSLVPIGDGLTLAMKRA